MKEILLSLTTIPGLLILLYVLGIFSNKTKNKLKFFSAALFMTFLVSLPIISKLISFPISSLAKKLTDENISDVKLVVVLTGGAYKNIMGEWQPSKNTENRIFHAKLFLDKHNLPLIISGGHTKKQAPSEAEIAKVKYNLEESVVEVQSLNTYESAKNLSHLCKDKEGSILIFTDKYHSLRTYLSFKTQGCNIIMNNYTSNISLNDFYPSLRGFSEFNAVIYEYIGILYYIGTLKINFLKLKYI